eukprot:TRINITY_DN46977_c0_g1_i1.p1 TRINITY_DN46977_c0_g1~~TRINITY_DN46977_c0_g1_i1.p1  ORF type:complete len:951 (+),score=203.52 TRINITY_DN46977_c0_g1_i1:65-2917(+)
MLPLEVTADAGAPRQRIHSFGASDAWTTSLLVADWSEEDRQRVATLLFDPTLDGDGRPRGIGLSCWRFLLGAGSKESKKEERVADPWRCTECFLLQNWRDNGGAKKGSAAAEPDGDGARSKDDELDAITNLGSYDFSRCVGQRWFLHAARRHGVEHLLMFVHSPPVHITSNRLSFGYSQDATEGHDNKGVHCNLTGDRFRVFAAYIGMVLTYFEQHGIHFTAVTPINEPHWNWDTNAQEGCAYSNEQCLRVARAVSVELAARGLAVAVGAPDAGCIDYLFRKIKEHENSKGFVGDATDSLGSGASFPLAAITGKSYFSCWPQEDRLISAREELVAAFRELRAHGVEYWVTEYSVYLPEGAKWVPEAARRALVGDDRTGEVFDCTGIDAALWAARVIHADICVAQASAWHWWLAMAPRGVQDGLIVVDPAVPGGFETTKALWVLGQWSLFVRPGMVQLPTERGDGLAERETVNGAMCSVFLDQQQLRLVVVCVNAGHCSQDIKLGITGFSGIVPAACHFRTFVTSSTLSLSPCCSFRLGNTCHVPKRSVLTAVCDLVDEDGRFHLVPGMPGGNTWCLELPVGAESTAGALVCAGELLREGQERQQWCFRQSEKGLGNFRILSAAAQLPLQVLHDSTAPRAPVMQGPRGDSPSQHWAVEYATANGFYIACSNTGHVLEAYGGTARVAQKSGRPEQLWQLVRAGSRPPPGSNPGESAFRAAGAAAAAWTGEWDVQEPPPTTARPFPGQPQSARYPQPTSPGLERVLFAEEHRAARRASRRRDAPPLPTARRLTSSLKRGSQLFVPALEESSVANTSVHPETPAEEVRTERTPSSVAKRHEIEMVLRELPQHEFNDVARTALVRELAKKLGTTPEMMLVDVVGGGAMQTKLRVGLRQGASVDTAQRLLSLVRESPSRDPTGSTISSGKINPHTAEVTEQKASKRTHRSRGRRHG